MKISIEMEIPDNVLKGMFGVADVNIKMVEDMVRISFYQEVASKHGDIDSVLDWIASDDVSEVERRFRKNLIEMTRKFNQKRKSK